ncbi:MAG: helix-turn-helix domain-containing protein [Clostridia bacterium]|nr:helix-turn-helix domain-containing protein [Clostridia bacterium]
MKKNTIQFEEIHPFTFSITHVPHEIPRVINDSHIHDQCEIYVNVSGEVSFMVEGQLYPVRRGDAIITRPFEYHHCVYRKIAPHEHYWILFSCKGNKKLLEPFFKRPLGTGNRIVPARPETLLALCERLTKKRSPFENYYDFFRLLQLLRTGEPSGESVLPRDLQGVLDEINEHFTGPLQIDALARDHFMSVNTLERQFKTHLGVTPSEYIRQKRLAHAALLLRRQQSVSRAAAESGFGDTSQFIAIFKKQFGKTPLQYKKEAPEA